jgi:hypothetical protein
MCEEVVEAAASFLQAEQPPLLHVGQQVAARVDVRFHRYAAGEGGHTPSVGCT